MGGSAYCNSVFSAFLGTAQYSYIFVYSNCNFAHLHAA